MKAKKVKKIEYVWQCDKCKSEYCKETEAEDCCKHYWCDDCSKRHATLKESEDCCVNIRSLKYGCCCCGTRHATREKEEACCADMGQYSCPLPGQSCYDCGRRTLER